VIDILYVAKNRYRYTVESFAALIENTDWSEVAALFIADDGSRDGSREYLDIESMILQDSPTRVVMNDKPFGGPVAAMNWYLDSASDDVEIFAKIDNDFVVCPGWLGDMARTMTAHPELDILGMEPFDHGVAPCPTTRDIELAPHIGGKGLMRHRTFAHCRPRPRGLRGYFGFTEFQTKHEHISKAWVTPDLPCFGLDQLPFEPWLSISAEYVELEWHRHWPPYSERAHAYWDWWVDQNREERVA
jgi:Glycosyl transferase family 2